MILPSSTANTIGGNAIKPFSLAASCTDCTRHIAGALKFSVETIITAADFAVELSSGCTERTLSAKSVVSVLELAGKAVIANARCRDVLFTKRTKLAAVDKRWSQFLWWRRKKKRERRYL